MAQKSWLPDQKIRATSSYGCPHCGHDFDNATPEDERRIILHRIMHVDNSSERWKLMDDWIAGKDLHDAPSASTRAQAG